MDPSLLAILVIWGGLKRLVAVPHTTLSTDVHLISFSSGLNVVIWLIRDFVKAVNDSEPYCEQSFHPQLTLSE